MSGKKPRRQPSSEDSAPARDTRPTVAERVAIVRRRLIDRTWHPDQAVELAEEWGVSVVLVQAHAAEAQRQIEAALDPAQVRARLDGLLLEAADRARQEPDHARAALALTAAAKMGAELAGLTRKHATPQPSPAKGDTSGAPQVGEKKPFWRRPAADKPS
jgi:hypothetical protein